MMSLAPHAIHSPTAAEAAASYRMERRLRVTHSLNYRYARPVRDIVTRLRLLPPPERGAQRTAHSRLRIAPLAAASERRVDAFGNALQELRHEKVWEHLTIVVELEMETACEYAADGGVLPARIAAENGLPPEGMAAFHVATPLTVPDSDLEHTAIEVRAGLPHDAGAADLAFALCRRVYHAMDYASGTTTVKTTATEAWAGKTGVCQDFAHILIALCRLAGLPARYVSGFLPGEGAMHAWVEVLTPATEGVTENGDAGGWIACDPTHDRWVNERYVAIAVGRDYADVSPTTGTFVGPGPGVLTHHSRVRVLNTLKTPVPPAR